MKFKKISTMVIASTLIFSSSISALASDDIYHYNGYSTNHEVTADDSRDITAETIHITSFADVDDDKSVSATSKTWSDSTIPFFTTMDFAQSSSDQYFKIPKNTTATFTFKVEGTRQVYVKFSYKGGGGVTLMDSSVTGTQNVTYKPTADDVEGYFSISNMYTGDLKVSNISMSY